MLNISTFAMRDHLMTLLLAEKKSKFEILIISLANRKEIGALQEVQI